MARREWQDRIVEKPRTFTMQENSDGTVTLVPAPGQVIQEGTPVNAANLNGIEQDIESHLADFETHENKIATETELGHVKVDGKTIFIQNGELSLVNPYVTILYDNGNQFVDWTTGYNSGTGTATKKTDNLYLEATSGERTYVTDTTIDLSNVSLLKAEITISRYSAIGNPTFYLIASSSKTGSSSAYDAVSSATGGDTVILDVSALEGEYYVRIHAKCSDASSWIKANTYKIWGEKNGI